MEVSKLLFLVFNRSKINLGIIYNLIIRLRGNIVGEIIFRLVEFDLFCHDIDLYISIFI